MEEDSFLAILLHEDYQNWVENLKDDEWISYRTYTQLLDGYRWRHKMIQIDGETGRLNFLPIPTPSLTEKVQENA
jgi:hypothetical protein